MVQTQSRFPRPDFESGYVYPEQHFFTPNEALWSYIDIALLVLLMGFVAWAVLKKQIRWPVMLTSVISIAYFGFFRHGCVCSIGAVQNVALGLASDSYTISLFVLLLFILPIIFTLFFGRVFCAGVCPIGALQEVVNIKNYKLSKAVTGILSIFPWIYLGFAVLFAVTNNGFIICRYDPFVGIFRLGGELPLLLFGILLLIVSVFTGRPFCRFICPYGAILSLFARVSFRQVKITKKECINCQLCHNACPVDAIRPPYDNIVKENRSTGVKRILRYIVFLPFMVMAGATVMYMLGDKFGKMNEEFQIWSGITGAFIGLVIGLTLINLSTKRTRKYYEIEDTDCVCCGRCFRYCPQNGLSQRREDAK
ncbi:MAG: 4Fe-4S binding protein [Lentimicrobiaceae bacterium]|nr:4Fe-4S binding protein [Lentimicrobiaceae bacterium]